MDILTKIAEHGNEIVVGFLVLAWLAGLAMSTGGPPKKLARIGK